MEAKAGKGLVLGEVGTVHADVCNVEELLTRGCGGRWEREDWEDLHSRLSPSLQRLFLDV